MRLILEVLLFLLSKELDRTIDFQAREEVGDYMRLVVKRIDFEDSK